jgi:hypothetical protein
MNYRELEDVCSYAWTHGRVDIKEIETDEDEPMEAYVKATANESGAIPIDQILGNYGVLCFGPRPDFVKLEKINIVKLVNPITGSDIKVTWRKPE